MNAGLAHTIESLFGPPSELVNVASFTQTAVEVGCYAVSSGETLEPGEEPLSGTAAAECNVSDLRDTLFQTWNNPRLSAHLLKDHEHKINTLCATAKLLKTKRKPHLPDPNNLPSEVTVLQRHLDNIQLSSWKLQIGSVLFMRSSKNSDQNALARVKNTLNPPIPATTDSSIITFSVHNKLAWGAGYAMRTSQHAILSSHTLEDLFKVIPCTSKDLGEVELGGVGQHHRANDCVICIEDVAYGYGECDDYVDKLLAHLETISRQKSTIKKGTTTICNTSIAALSLRINQPYWFLHQGNCEHFIVVDQIRFQHPSDTSSIYPLTLQITPPLLDLCRVCSRVPAVLSVMGDVRLGESPCLVCDPCWRGIGDPNAESRVLVKSLPRH
ncbi:snRNA-activating protein of 50kDa MW C terminal-domain-containing protein [Collybia nuda]|uniref:snRNA-activating protein of 50kDa MW C terminal-domain-containing protein n=1 Tax=Collybia nuda TaxID=64659 RepID=A0A9P5YIY8_9AGAR|nr:snRNA-activating protein of 50kDa MW C terminal-domain-containing protein [Collybia nuda]